MEYTKLFETDRLILRKATINDAENIFNNYASRDKVTEFLSWKTHKSLKDTYEYLEKIMLPRYNEECYCWYLVLKENNQVIGCIDVNKFDKNKKQAELGWVLSDDYWGKGLMPEAAIVVIEYIKSLGFVRIYARHNVANLKSGRVMQKLDMKFEGILRKSDLDNKGNLVDMAIYSYINGED